MRWTFGFVLTATVLAAGCNQQQAAAAATSVGEAYNLRYRDDVIKNWQRRVADSSACASFKERFKAAGERYDSAANAQFVGDMMKVMDAVKADHCEYAP